MAPTLEDLCADRARGASELARDAVATLSQLDQGARPGAALRLVRCHPAMAPLVWLAHALLTQGASNEQLARRVEGQRRREATLQRHLRARLAGLSTVATYSRSGTVLAALTSAALDPRPRVLVSEARPGDEGRSVARAVVEAGGRARFTTDAALHHHLPQANALVVGADALTDAGPMNKVGTAALARTARAAGVAVVVAAAGDKAWPATLGAAPQGEAAVAWPGAPEGVEQGDPLFEAVPWSLVDEVVWEAGVVGPSAVVHQLERDVHPAVLEAVEEGLPSRSSPPG